MKRKLLIYLLNIVGVIVALLLIIWGLNTWMHSYTRHGETIEVPDITKVRLDKAIEMLEEGGFRYEVIDSVYRDNFNKMDIVEQDPIGGSFVKKGRRIYLIVNALDKPKVQMPRLTNKSLSLAKVLLKNSGLNLGRIENKKTTLGDGLVLAQMLNGDTIKPYTLVVKGATIDLIVSIKPDESDQFDEFGNLIEHNEFDFPEE